jgi:hypothetical protein
MIKRTNLDDRRREILVQGKYSMEPLLALADLDDDAREALASALETMARDSEELAHHAILPFSSAMLHSRRDVCLAAATALRDERG